MRIILASLLVVVAFACAGCGPEAGGPGAQRIIEAKFPNDPIMVKVAKCESGLRQFTQNGSVLHGAVHHADSGLFQINKAVHGRTAKELGLDLDTAEGNADYAVYLRDKYGMAPWASSRNCWGRSKYLTATN